MRLLYNFISFLFNELGHSTGSPNAVLANRKIKCIYTVSAYKIRRNVFLCSCVFMSRFGRDLNPIRDGDIAGCLSGAS